MHVEDLSFKAKCLKQSISIFFLQEVAIFSLLILLVSHETFCRPEGLNRKLLDTSLPTRIEILASMANSSWSYVESQLNPHSDSGCVKMKRLNRGRNTVTIECRSAHPDCFKQSNSKSPLFGQCVSVVNRKNVVIACQCAAWVQDVNRETLSTDMLCATKCYKMK